MGEIKLLDCTLRDGGYINNWDFGHNHIVSLFERSAAAGTDFIEVGFLDERVKFDINRTIMPDTDSADKIFAGLDKKQSEIVCMIDYGTCGIENIRPAAETTVDCIRVIFKKHLREGAMAFCAELKKLGYRVFAQLVSVTSYNDDEMHDLIRIANKVKPYAVSMVDTYGLLHQNSLKRWFELINSELSPDIALGYHAHNNFQMAYANCIAFLAENTDRTVLVDGTIYGMGKSAGNAPIELLVMHLNRVYGKNYNIDQFLEAIDSDIVLLCPPQPWGYSLKFFIAALNDCHPNYVAELVGKRTLSVKSVDEILKRIPDEKKLLYDKNYIDRLYLEDQANDIDDTADIKQLSALLGGKDILVLGPCPIDDDLERVLQKAENSVVISINFAPKNIRTDYVFLCNSKRYIQLAAELSQKNTDYRVIAASNVTKTNGNFDFNVNYRALYDENADPEYADNAFLMLMRFLKKV
ncbi:MAG: aldolase catalytic domain-containing protein, partial [Firmicutes bacterium]|nr:aldolase catalytic domain-containing protein [Bacillota bacterium]